jgi:acylphosphatase
VNAQGAAPRGASSQETLRLRVFGRIQGVGFRSWACQNALRLKIRGWVRNETDGTVSCECQGPADALEVFTAALRRGPPYARVGRIEVSPVAQAQTYRGFEIAY